MKAYFSSDGVYLSINGKQGKPIRSASTPKRRKRISFDPIAAIRIRSLHLSLSVGGDPLALSWGLGMTMTSLASFLSYLTTQGVLDRGTVRVLPRPTDSTATVNFSIRIFSSLAMILGALTHTTRGDNDERRSDSEYNG